MYKTNDIALACALKLMGHEMEIRIDQERATFVFKGTEPATIATRYFKNDLLLPIQEFWTSMRSLKTQINGLITNSEENNPHTV